MTRKSGLDDSRTSRTRERVTVQLDELIEDRSKLASVTILYDTAPVRSEFDKLKARDS